MTVDREFEKEIAELVDGDVWVLADRLAERFSAAEYGEGSKNNSGLYAELLEYSNALREDYGIKLSVSSMRRMRATSLAWSHGTRSPCAPFKVHTMLRAADGHEHLIEKLIKLNGGRLTVADVQRWREDSNPKPLVSWDDQFDRKIRRALKQADPRTTESRDLLIAKLEQLAQELRVA